MKRSTGWLAVVAAAWCCIMVPARSGAPHWVGSWATAQMAPEGQAELLGNEAYRDATLRQIVHLSLGGAAVRVRLTNAFGTMPLHLVAVHVAIARHPGSPAIDPASDRALTFAGEPDVVVPPGATYLSDPVALVVPAHADLAISIHYDQAPAGQSGHPGSRATSFLIRGDHVQDSDLPTARKVDRWYQIAAVDVAASPTASAVAVLGDSITDGHGATTNGNDRWTDVWAGRLTTQGVLNLGIAGNRMSLDCIGVNALARFDRDILAQSGVKTVILFEGINDLGKLTHDLTATPAEHAAMVRHVIASYQQVVARAHAAGLAIVGVTLMPFADSTYYQPTAENEADRLAVNAWIRAPGHFDRVIDFDVLMRDPAHPDRLNPSYDSGDHLHPSPAGYRTMGEAVPLTLPKEP